ncbi:MAG: cell division protein ZapA [Bacteroidales bacterium]|jgi:cell division protein ZapA|nr:cell division protein ZapA [Bacteroidales bacterium]
MNINVKIAERPYTLTVDNERDEQRVRRAAQYINERLSSYRVRFSEKDVQDLLAMAAIQFVVKLIKLENNSNQTDVNERLKQLNDQVSEFLVN